MLSLIIQEIPYQKAEVLFDRIRHLPRPVLLDSGYPNSRDKGCDIMAADPAFCITTNGQFTRLTGSDVPAKESRDDPFAVLQEALDRYPQLTRPEHIPFAGGAIGYFAYDLVRRVERLRPDGAMHDIKIPDMDLGIYLWNVIVDHQSQRTYFCARPELPETQRTALLALLKPSTALEREPTHQAFKLASKFSSNMTQHEYQKHLCRIEDYIHAGDCYQVNFAQRFSADYVGSEWDAYRQLRSITDAPFSAFLHTDSCALLCLSPERFIRIDDAGKVETKPIKGTRPRGDSESADKDYAQALQSSSKDRAENLMIVDLLRNDLSKNCELGSVTAPRLFEVEQYSNVHHLVSTINGQLQAGQQALDLFRGCFPGGSITGAPKLRAMEIIEELEPHRRSVYCGSVAYIGFEGQMDSNIAIRTILCSEQRMHCWGGGGIVADSDAMNEYRESILKIEHLLEGLPFSSADHPETR